MEQLTLWPPEELPIPCKRPNLRSPSASRAFSRALRQVRLCEQPSQQSASSQTRSKDSSSSTELSKKSARSFRSSSLTVTTEVNDAGRAIGEHHQNARYTDSEVEMVRTLRQEGYTVADVALMMDMPIRTVRGYIDGSRRSQSVAGWRKQKRCQKKN